MDCALANCKRSFLDRFGTRWMSMAGPGKILCRATKLHQYGRFVDHFARLAADNMNAEHPVRLRICENLDESFRRLIHLGAAIRGKWEFSDGISDASLLQLFLRLTDGRYFRRGIHNTWNDVVIHVARLSRENLRDRDPLVLGLVREHWSRDDIADRIDAFHAGCEMRIDLH